MLVCDRKREREPLLVVLKILLLPLTPHRKERNEEKKYIQISGNTLLLTIAMKLFGSDRDEKFLGFNKNEDGSNAPLYNNLYYIQLHLYFEWVNH